MNHTGVGLPLWDLHLEEKLQLPAGLVEDVRYLVLALREEAFDVTPCGKVAGKVLVALIPVEQRPDADPTIDDVLSVIARVVPTAGDVERVIAPRVFGTGSYVLRVPRRARQVQARRVGLVYRRTTSIQVEVLQSVVLQFVVNAGIDVERVTLLAGNLEHVTLTRSCERAEVHEVQRVTGRSVRRKDLCFALRHRLPLGIQQLVVERLFRGAHDRSNLDELR